MNIVITSGGTTEPIDTVRSIQNTSTGRLGATIASTFDSALAGMPHKIFYICAENTARPSQSAHITALTFRTVADLQERLRSVCVEHRVAAIVHAAAVSDYRVAKVALWDTVHSATDAGAISDLREQYEGGKLPSTLDYLVLCMERTPKIIAELRTLSPQAVIIGFKLLDSVPHDELISVAQGVLCANRCDFVLANDASQIHGEQHTGYLIDAHGTETQFSTKQEIAQGIVKAVLERRQAE